MADGYDNLYEYFKRDLQMDKDDVPPIFKCRKGGKLKAGRKLSGVVEHRCVKCGHVIMQPWEEYRTAFNKQDGHYYEVDCPMVTMYRSKRGRVR